MRRLSGPLGGAAETGTLKAAEGDWRKLMSRRRKKRNTDWDNKSMKIQRKYDKYWWEVSVKQEWRNKQIEMKMVVEDVIMIWWDNYHDPKKKKQTTGMWKHFIWFVDILVLKSRKSEHGTAVIYELITALQLTSKLLYLFTHLIVIQAFFFFFIWLLIFSTVLFQVQVCGTKAQWLTEKH